MKKLVLLLALFPFTSCEKNEGKFTQEDMIFTMQGMEDFINTFIMVGIIFCILAIQILTALFIFYLIKNSR
jgi:hypothetical protein